ncbi:hypothetical protein D3C83_231900 [compost metagenome]
MYSLPCAVGVKESFTGRLRSMARYRVARMSFVSCATEALIFEDSRYCMKAGTLTSEIMPMMAVTTRSSASEYPR